MNIKVLFFCFGPEIIASCRTRVYQYIPYLGKYGIAPTVINYISFKRAICDTKSQGAPLSLKIKNFFFKISQGLRALLLARSYDVIIVQRVLLPLWQQHALKFLNPRIVFDFDDALYIVPQLTRRFNNMLQISSHLITTSKDNLEYANRFNKNVSLIPTPVDLRRYYPKIQRKDSYPVVVGWIGSLFTAKYLEMLKEVFKGLQEKYRERLMIKFIGSGRLDWNDIGYQYAEWDLDTELEHLQSFDIGVMPLEDNQWCRGKGGYKLLQYMALGIPCVASAVGINKEIIKDGLSGFFAETKEEWIERLSTLIEDEGLRVKMGSEGRKKAEEVYSHQVNVPKLVDIIVSTKNNFS